ncbi:MAG: F0F1 ATP synthase subunit A [Bacillaceae bacterium]|nr:F0F1 ATP synthase subunit A [Bacillaceae bacterium]
MEHVVPTVKIFGLYIDLAVVISSVVASLLVFLIIWLATRNMTEGVPRGMQNFLEWLIDFVRGIIGQFMDMKTGSKYVTLAFTLFLYIFISNQLGLLFNVTTAHHEPVEAIGVTEEVLEHHHGEAHVAWWKSPTATPSVTFALAIAVLLYSHYAGIRKSPSEYFKHYFQPNPLMFPMHLIEEASKFMTLPLRLFGNIFAGEVLIVFLLGGTFLVTGIPLVIWLGYSVFVGAIQAFIFTTLTMVYISQKVVDSH